MVNKWFIRPGQNGWSWNRFKDHNCIAIGWDDKNDYRYTSLEDVKRYHKSNNANAIWNFYKIMEPGDIVIAIRNQNNVLGIGIITSDYIPPSSPENPNLEYPHVRKVDWKSTEPITLSYKLPTKTLTKVNAESKWKEIFDKYIELSPSLIDVLDPPHNPDNATKAEVKREFPVMHDLLSNTKNLILYGPPGTGKTFVVQNFTKDFLKHQLSKPKSPEEIKKEFIQDLKWHQVIALAVYLNGKDKRISVPELKNSDLIQYYFKHIKGRNKNLSQTLWAQLQIYATSDSETVNYAKKNTLALFDKEADNSEWYLIPAGIEYVENSLSEVIDALSGKGNVAEEKTFDYFCTFITFHQSYGYEDFIEGLKPAVNEDGEISYQVEEGVFKDICERAREDKDNKYVLVIDEINRGNIAKIFGELITLIEDDKRSGNDNELCVKLPYSKEKFSVPSNLYIIGTMNTADRSIALLDIALRRRFTFHEVMPDYSIIDHNIDGINTGALLKQLNTMLSALIDRNHQIGHSYFCEFDKLNDEEARKKLYFIWYKKIIPLLQEYFYNDWAQLKLILGDFITENDISIPQLKDTLTNKHYEIKTFKDDWPAFSTALNKIINVEGSPNKNEEEPVNVNENDTE